MALVPKDTGIIHLVRAQIFRKTNITPQYQGVRNVSFWKILQMY